MNTSLNPQGFSADGKSDLSSTPFTTSDGVPKVVIFIRTDAGRVYEATLDGHPAIAVIFGRDIGGKSSPEILADQLTEHWYEAKKLAAAKKQTD